MTAGTHLSLDHFGRHIIEASTDATTPSGGTAAPDEEPPLKGVRVLDMSHLLAGPYCAQLLADQGADVIKIEPPTGDISRRRIPARVNDLGERASAYFLSVNRGKRSVAADVKTDEGRARVLSLLESADVLVENFRPEVLERLLMPRQELAQRFPRLVVVSISAFGIRGIPDETRNLPGLAIVGEALSGTLAYSRGDGDEPNWAGGFPLGDFTTGLAAHAAVVGALLRRERTGKGALLDISISDAMLSINSTALAKHGVTVGTDTPGESYRAAPYGIFPAKDGYLVLGVNTDEFWRRLCVAMERPDLSHDERYAADASRMVRKAEVDGLVADWTRGLPRDVVLKRLADSSIPSAPVNYPADIVKSAIYRQRGMLLEVEDGIGGTIVLPSNPLGPSYARPHVPQLGEDPDATF
jgi:crotonobetainyl-CoA:carnitine CoA-transferase CaiB-like acyl-CoA transferase